MHWVNAALHGVTSLGGLLWDLLWWRLSSWLQSWSTLLVLSSLVCIIWCVTTLLTGDKISSWIFPSKWHTFLESVFSSRISLTDSRGDKYTIYCKFQFVEMNFHLCQLWLDLLSPFWGIFYEVLPHGCSYFWHTWTRVISISHPFWWWLINEHRWNYFSNWVQRWLINPEYPELLWPYVEG